MNMALGVFFLPTSQNRFCFIACGFMAMGTLTLGQAAYVGFNRLIASIRMCMIFRADWYKLSLDTTFIMHMSWLLILTAYQNLFFPIT